MKLTEKQIAKAEALRKPWMQNPYDAADLRAQIKDFERCAQAARKVLAIIVPTRVSGAGKSVPTMGKNDGLGK